MKQLTAIIASLMALFCAEAQNGVAIGNPPGASDASAILDLKSTTKGMLVPRMNANARGSITAPATGLLVYQTDGASGFWYYNGSAWGRVADALSGDNLGNHTMTKALATKGFTLSKHGTTKGINILDSGGVAIVTNNYPLGATATTAERFRFDVAGGFVAKGILGVGTIPATGAGERMMWHPNKGAFRAGSIGSAGFQWDDFYTGYYSASFGYNTIAQGLSSFSAGYNSAALGSYSHAVGYTCAADGTGALALGYRCTADADYSTAIGQRASTNGHAGAMVFSDASTVDSTEASANNQFMARFAGGYRFYTNVTTTVGVSITAGGNSWSAISDSTKKENYQPAASEQFLDKLSELNLGSWNYKGQDPKEYRHYGAMAQEIFAAYGKDHYGRIGCDTTLASADMDGIMMIILQGLEKRSREQNNAMKKLEKENTDLKMQLAELNELKAEVQKLAALSKRD